MEKMEPSLQTCIITKQSFILLALLLCFAGCDKEDAAQKKVSKIFFKVYEINTRQKAALTSLSSPVSDAGINIYSKIGDQYKLQKTLKTDSQGEAVAEGKDQETIYYEVIKGSSSNLHNGYEITGTFISEEEIANSPFQGPGTKVGDLKFKDVNQDGVISASDKVEKYVSTTFGYSFLDRGISVLIAPTDF